MNTETREKAKLEQIAKQCEAVAYLANAVRELHEDTATLVRAGHWPAPERLGLRTAALMEFLGNFLNEIDAVTAEDDRLEPVFKAAQQAFPDSITYFFPPS